MFSKPCFHCYRLGHPPSELCPNDGLIACTKCFRLYVFSKGCNCVNKRLPDPPQVLRLIGKKKAPKWITDVCINDQLFPAMLNTGLTRCRVSTAFAKWWQDATESPADNDSNVISIEIKRKGRRIRVACDIVQDLGDQIHIHLGTELMTFLGYTFTMENITVKSNHSPVLSSPYESEYVYNLPSVGEDLRNYLSRKRHFLKRGKPINKGYVDLHPKRDAHIRRSSQDRVIIIRRSSTTSLESHD